MKKRLILLLFIFLLTTISGCKRVEEQEKEEEKKDYEIKNIQLIECLSNELGAHIVSDKLDAHELPIKEIFKETPKDMTYYEGVYSSDDNLYVIYSSSPTVMSDLDVIEKYFASRYKEYYRYYPDYEGVYIYFHNSLNEIGFDEIMDRCTIRDEEKENDKKEEMRRKMPESSLKKLKNTNKIVIKKDDKEVGIIKSKKSIKKVLDALDSSYTTLRDGDLFICNGRYLDLEMYNGNQKLDTVFLSSNGFGVNLESINSFGCILYGIGEKDLGLNQLIKKETDYIHFYILDLSDSDEERKDILIGEDNKYKYYFEGKTLDDVFITFDLTGRTKRLTDAIKDKDITLKHLEYNWMCKKQRK